MLTLQAELVLSHEGLHTSGKGPHSALLHGACGGEAFVPQPQQVTATSEFGEGTVLNVTRDVAWVVVHNLYFGGGDVPSTILQTRVHEL